MATCAFGGLVGGLAGAVFVVAVTLALKETMDSVSSQATWVLIVAPLLGLALAVLVLQGVGQTLAPGATPPRAGRWALAWRAFPPRAVRADITGDVVDTAGEEERFNWRLAPIRAVAIFCTVGLGGAMGTEAPAAYLGTAVGACLGDRGRWWRKLLRPAALAGGAAGVAALMGIALVGTAYMLELGRRHRAPLTAERVIAALIGGFVGWGTNIAFRLDLIRLIVPKEPPANLSQGVKTALFIGAISGAITSLAGASIYRAKKWQASPGVRLGLGGLATGVTAVVLALMAAPSAAVGPGGGAILWAEDVNALPPMLLAVTLLRATATTAAVAAGGCGGVFVPFLAIGDIAGRVFAPGLEVGNDLAGAAGAAGGIAGGYRLPFTAIAMVLGVGGPRLATLTCLVTVVVASLAGAGAGVVVDRVTGLPYLWRRARSH
ncbi:MAG TPA: chloride channel protein [Anaeromyxobacteraceae bacterium]|jgi:H+/Cl- antiporter ClcA|nr:chloride channel protein [Anaeromyxobacteraceae bacterium]